MSGMAHGLHSFRSSLGLLLRIEQSIHCRTRARERSITRSVAGLAVEHTLNVTQFGMLREYDAFEVVLNPGTDEVEKLCLGPVPASCGNTGCWSLVTATQPCIYSAAERYDFSGLRSNGQSCCARGRTARACHFHGFALGKGIPVRECLRGGNPDLGGDYDAINARNILKRKYLLAASFTVNRAAN